MFVSASIEIDIQVDIMTRTLDLKWFFQLWKFYLVWCTAVVSDLRLLSSKHCDNLISSNVPTLQYDCCGVRNVHYFWRKIVYCTIFCSSVNTTFIRFLVAFFKSAAVFTRPNTPASTLSSEFKVSCNYNSTELNIVIKGPDLKKNYKPASIIVS